MDSSHRPVEPQRLSALYQYHNAPEVAPAHGLEYDDTIYPSSDKYPVIRDPYLSGKAGKYGFVGDNRPPRIIFGMKVRTFLMVAAVMVLIIVGAAVGGAVGGQSIRDSSHNSGLYTNITAPTPTSTFSAPVPTYTPLSDCPASDNTKYTSAFSTRDTPAASSAGLTFTKSCNRQNPLVFPGAQSIAAAFVYSFSDCVEVCAAYNYWNDGANCTIAVYQPTGVRPGNCWVGHAESVKVSNLNETEGTDVAILYGR